MGKRQSKVEPTTIKVVPEKTEKETEAGEETTATNTKYKNIICRILNKYAAVLVIAAGVVGSLILAGINHHQVNTLSSEVNRNTAEVEHLHSETARNSSSVAYDSSILSNLRDNLTNQFEELMTGRFERLETRVNNTILEQVELINQLHQVEETPIGSVV